MDPGQASRVPGPLYIYFKKFITVKNIIIIFLKKIVINKIKKPRGFFAGSGPIQRPEPDPV